MFFGIVGCPSSDDQTTSSTSNFISKPLGDTNGTGPSGNGDGSSSPVPEPATLLLLGAGLVSLAVVGRKRFKK